MKHLESCLNDSPLLVTPELQLLGMGIHQTSPAGIIHRPLGTEGLLLTVFHSEALVRLKGIEHSVPPSSLVIWEPGQRHYYGNDGAGWTHSWLRFAGVWFHEQLADAQIPTHRLLTLDRADVCDHFLQELWEECIEHAAADPEIVRLRFTLWCRQIQRILHAPSTEHTIPAPWLELKHFLDTHYTEPLTLGFLAERMSVSPQHFARLFKHYFQSTVMEYLKQLRLEQARFLLSDHNYSISEIARRTGYESITYFSRAFSEYFGANPRAMRKGMSGEAARQRLAKERRSAELARWTREGWQMMRQMDFSTIASIDADWQACSFRNDRPDPMVLHPAPELTEISEGALHIRMKNAYDWTALRYTQEVGEETKLVVQVRNVRPEGPNLAIAISGDLQTGYRLRIVGYEHIDLETIQNGYWEVLQRCPVTLDPHAQAYTFVFWRSGDTFYAEIDGERCMTHDEPFAALGAAHRTIGLGRYGTAGDAYIESLQIWSRRTPRYVDILEPGRVLLRQRHHEEALQWFRSIAEEHHEADIQSEAAYLMALATPDDAGMAREAALQRVMLDNESPYRTRALRPLALHRLARHDYAGAIDSALLLQRRLPDTGLIQHIAQTMVADLAAIDFTDHEPILAQLARLPLSELDFIDTPLQRLDALSGMRLSRLLCGPGYIDDLSPLTGMRLTYLICYYNRLTDLTPLTGMPLASCILPHNFLSDLSPLTDMPLEALIINSNRITDLTPLYNMPLQILDCNDNTINDLTPIAALPLTRFACAVNQIHDLQPLASLPLGVLDCKSNPIRDFSCLPASLQALDCTDTHITDLQTISHLSLSTLNCGHNAITDLTPISSMPLTALDCMGTPIADLTPLTRLPLVKLGINKLPPGHTNAAAFTALPLCELRCQCLDTETLELIKVHPTLRSVNGHDREHVLRVAPAACTALDTWHTQPDASLQSPFALREWAMPVGDRAYLALPIQLSWQEALAFSAWQGGALISPATNEQFTALQHYLASVVISASPVFHFIGLLIEQTHRTMRWHSGAPYSWQPWQSSVDRLFHPHRDSPPFISSGIHRFHTWWDLEWSPYAYTYTVIEWDA